jgi:hypothetical protein
VDTLLEMSRNQTKQYQAAHWLKPVSACPFTDDVSF